MQEELRRRGRVLHHERKVSRAGDMSGLGAARRVRAAGFSVLLGRLASPPAQMDGMRILRPAAESQDGLCGKRARTDWRNTDGATLRA